MPIDDSGRNTPLYTPASDIVARVLVSPLAILAVVLFVAVMALFTPIFWTANWLCRHVPKPSTRWLARAEARADKAQQWWYDRTIEKWFPWLRDDYREGKHDAD